MHVGMTLVLHGHGLKLVISATSAWKTSEERMGARSGQTILLGMITDLEASVSVSPKANSSYFIVL